MKYQATIDTDDFEDFEFFEDRDGDKYLRAVDKCTEVGDWLVLYFRESQEENESDKRYNRLFDALKYNWMINCEHDVRLTDKIDRCEAALITLKNLGFNLVNGEIEK